MTPLPNAINSSDAITEIHAAVRKWTEHIPVNLPYVDLMFAFGYATLGDSPRALALVEDAREAMVVPIPEAWNDHKHFEATVSAVTSNFLFKAFCYRIEQALAGKPHFGPLSDEVLANLMEITNRAHAGGTNNPYLRADHVIALVRMQSRILEPQERIDPYSYWTKNQDLLKRALCELQQVGNPEQLANRIRELYRSGVGGKPTPESRLGVLNDALPLSPRVSEAFTAELLGLVPEALPAVQSDPRKPQLVMKGGALLERAFFLSGHFGRRDLVEQLATAFVAMMRDKIEEDRFRLVNAAAGPCLRAMKKLGMRTEIDRVFTELQREVLRGQSLAELRTKYLAKHDVLGTAMQAVLNLAGDWLVLGNSAAASPILEAVRHELLAPDALRFPPKEYTALAQAYVTALGEMSSDIGAARILELFRRMPPQKITNTWTTAQYFSRFHLNLVEDTVLALTRTEWDRPQVVQG